MGDPLLTLPEIFTHSDTKLIAKYGSGIIKGNAVIQALKKRWALTALFVAISDMSMWLLQRYDEWGIQGLMCTFIDGHIMQQLHFNFFKFLGGRLLEQIWILIIGIIAFNIMFYLTMFTPDIAITQTNLWVSINGVIGLFNVFMAIRLYKKRN